MKLFPTLKAEQLGQSPGTLVYRGRQKVEQVRVSLIDFSTEVAEEKEVDNIQETFSYKQKPTVTWINIDGLHDVDLIKDLGEHYDIHALVMEDILNTQHRPKLEERDDYVFVTLKMLHYDADEKHVVSEQVSLLLGDNFLLSFQERQGDVFETVRERIRSGKKRIRGSGGDYLLYALIDAIVDQYYLVVEALGIRIEELEDNVIESPDDGLLEDIHKLRKELVSVRHAVWPLREVVENLRSSELNLIQTSTYIYIEDVYDHVIQIRDAVDNFRDMLTGVLDVYRSSIDAKTNDVMRLLTIIATIFIPLTFVAGIYGMNFNPEVSVWNMPELNWAWGYPAVWLVMIVITAGMVVYFRRKGWF